MSHNICHVILYKYNIYYVMLYNMCCVMLYNMCHVILYNICHVMSYNITCPVIKHRSFYVI